MWPTGWVQMRCLKMLTLVSGLDLSGTNLSGADFSNTSGWAEAIFAGAFYDPENVPEWANGMTPLEMGITPIPPAVNVADYNDDGFVDAADYTVWRDTMGETVTPETGADGDGDGYIGLHDYGVWTSHFGWSVEGESGAVGVPEPATVHAVLLATCLLMSVQRARISGNPVQDGRI